jgi:hypothetical protein
MEASGWEGISGASSEVGPIGHAVAAASEVWNRTAAALGRPYLPLTYRKAIDVVGEMLAVGGGQRPTGCLVKRHSWPRQRPCAQHQSLQGTVHW